jgi:hypothetical protein
MRDHKVLTYVEYRAVSGVFQNIDLPHPLSTQGVCPPPAPKAVGGGGTHSPGGEGVGGSIFRKTTPDIGLAYYSIIAVRERLCLLGCSQARCRPPPPVCLSGYSRTQRLRYYSRHEELCSSPVQLMRKSHATAPVMVLQCEIFFSHIF